MRRRDRVSLAPEASPHERIAFALLQLAANLLLRHAQPLLPGSDLERIVEGGETDHGERREPDQLHRLAAQGLQEVGLAGADEAREQIAIRPQRIAENRADDDDLEEPLEEIEQRRRP